MDSPRLGWTIHEWQTDDGLPHNHVTSIAQTTDGYLWVGTLNGLSQFDGIRFARCPLRRFAQQRILTTRYIIPSRDGGLWAAIDYGPIIHLNREKTQVYSSGLPSAIPSAMIEDSDGGVLVGYRDGNLFQLKGGKVSSLDSSLPNWGELSLAKDREGRIWCGKAGRVGLLRNGKFIVLTRVHGSGLCVAAASAGGVWIWAGEKLYRYVEGGDLKAVASLQLNHTDLLAKCLIEDHSGAVWIGTAADGLFRYDGSGFSAIPTAHSGVLGVIEDREGNIWVATAGGGLNRIQRRVVAFEGKENGLPLEAVQSLCEDAEGNIWAATQSGLLARRSLNRWEQVPCPGGGAMSVTADANGALWVGTRGDLLCWRNGRFSTLGKDEGLRGGVSHVLAIGGDGDLWISRGASYIHHLENGRISTCNFPVNVRVIWASAQDLQGNIWLGSSKGTLLRINGQKITDETPANFVRSIRCLHTTADGSLWIGFAGAGLGRLKDGHFSLIRTAQGLFDDAISQIISDERGWLWFGGDHGIFKIRQRDLENTMDGQSLDVKSVPYGRSHGLPSLQASYGSAPGALRSRDGRLWLPMSTGVAIVDPLAISEEIEPPPVFIESVATDDHIMAERHGAMPINRLSFDLSEKALQVKPEHRRLEFAFTALSFASPDDVRFRYRLEGYEDEWIDPGTRRSAIYSRLPAGHYLFHVMACNRDGIWNNLGAAVAFTVTPFFWQTIWCRSLILVVFTSVVAGSAYYLSLRRMRMKLQELQRQAALDRERARIARDIHDDLGGNLTQIKLLFELASRDKTAPDRVAIHLADGLAAARQGIKLLDETVWAVNPGNDTLSHLVEYIAQFAVQVLQRAGIRCRVSLPKTIPDCVVSSEARHHLFLAIKEALSNVVQHAGATEVVLDIATTETSMHIQIQDNGRGFNGTAPEPGSDGLHNMRQRMEELGGVFEMQSIPGKGTSLQFHYSWRKQANQPLC